MFMRYEHLLEVWEDAGWKFPSDYIAEILLKLDKPKFQTWNKTCDD